MTYMRFSKRRASLVGALLLVLPAQIGWTENALGSASDNLSFEAWNVDTNAGLWSGVSCARSSGTIQWDEVSDRLAVVSCGFRELAWIPSEKSVAKWRQQGNQGSPPSPLRKNLEKMQFEFAVVQDEPGRWHVEKAQETQETDEGEAARDLSPEQAVVGARVIHLILTGRAVAQETRAFDPASVRSGSPPAFEDSPFETQPSVWNRGEQEVRTSMDLAFMRTEGYMAEIVVLHHFADRTLAFCVEVNTGGIRPKAKRDAALAEAAARVKAFLYSFGATDTIADEAVVDFVKEWAAWSTQVCEEGSTVPEHARREARIRVQGFLYDIRPGSPSVLEQADQPKESAGSTDGE
jgi:hypothetical protein